MKTLSVCLTDSLLERVNTLATKEGVSPDEFITLAVVEKVATLETVDYLAERAKRGSRERLLAILAKAPDVEPAEYDRL